MIIKHIKTHCNMTKKLTVLKFMHTNQLTLCMLDNFSLFFVFCRFFQKSFFLKVSFRNTIKVSNSLECHQLAILFSINKPYCISFIITILLTWVQIMKPFERKILIIFIPINLNMYFGCSKEPSH